MGLGVVQILKTKAVFLWVVRSRIVQKGGFNELGFRVLWLLCLLMQYLSTCLGIIVRSREKKIR